MNWLETISEEHFTRLGLAWSHPPLDVEALAGGGMRVSVPAFADYFQDPTGTHIKDNAPYLRAQVSGNFIARALVRPTFATIADAGAIMLRHDAHHWAKVCFESTEPGRIAAVSVVTRGISDDANGADQSGPSLWLQALRVGPVFAFHYSADGAAWRLQRIFTLDMPETIQVGLVAQSPLGPGTLVDFLSFEIELRSASNPRAGA